MANYGMVLMTRDPDAHMQLHIAATPASGVMNHANYCAIMVMIFGARYPIRASVRKTLTTRRC